MWQECARALSSYLLSTNKIINKVKLILSTIYIFQNINAESSHICYLSVNDRAETMGKLTGKNM